MTSTAAPVGALICVEVDSFTGRIHEAGYSAIVCFGGFGALLLRKIVVQELTHGRTCGDTFVDAAKHIRSARKTRALQGGYRERRVATTAVVVF